MIQDIRDTDEPAFLRHWAERVWDQVQLAQIDAIQQALINYIATGWRPPSIDPPKGMLLICACEEGLVLMMQNDMGDWRTNQGMPHKPPKAWMPAPFPPKV